MQPISNQIYLTWPDTSFDSRDHREHATTQQVFDAVDSGDSIRVNALFGRYSVDLTVIDDSCGDTPLHRAAARGHDEIVEILLSHANNDPTILDARDRNGMTPLISAAEKPSIPSIIALIVAGASLGQSTSAQHPEMANADDQRSYDDRMSLIKTLIEADGDISLGASIALKNSADKVVFWCMKERLRSLPSSHDINPKYVGIDKLIIDINTRFFDEFKEILDSRSIAINDLVVLMDDVFKSSAESTRKKLCYLCGESVFINSLLEYYAFNEGEQKLLMFMLDTSLKSKPVAAEVLLSIAGNKDRSQAEKKSALQALGKVTSPKIIDDLLANLLGRNDRETLKLMASVDISLSAKCATNHVIAAVESNDYDKIRLLTDIGVKCLDLIQFRLENEEDSDFFVKAACFVINLIKSNPPEEMDNDTKTKEIAKWVGIDVTIDEAITKIMLNELDSGCFENIELFIKAGVKNENLLIDLCRQDKIEDARRVIRMGGSFGNALMMLKESVEFFSKKSKIKSNDGIYFNNLVSIELGKIEKLNEIEQGLQASIKRAKAACQNIINITVPTRKNKRDLATLRADIKYAQDRLIGISHEVEQVSQRAARLAVLCSDANTQAASAARAEQDHQIVLNRLASAVRTRDI